MRKKTTARIFRLDERKSNPRPETRDPDKDVFGPDVTDKVLLDYLFRDIEELRK